MEKVIHIEAAMTMRDAAYECLLSRTGHSPKVLDEVIVLACALGDALGRAEAVGCAPDDMSGLLEVIVGRCIANVQARAEIELERARQRDGQV